MQNNPPVFTAEQVSCTVPSPDGDRIVFSGLAFAIARGEIVDLVGPSGSGKSSLLTAFARLNPHATGTFMLEGRTADGFTPQRWRREVAYLPQKPILPGNTVAEAIRLPFTLAVRADAPTAAAGADGDGRQGRFGRGLSRFFRSDGAHARELLPNGRIRGTLDAMGCDDIDLERHPHDLSGGQAARISLARTLLTEPKVLLADEVDAGLDDENADRVASIMAYAAGRGMAIVRIRHRPPDGRASRIVTLEGGALTETMAEAADGKGAGR
ncbi:ABC transporter ATP-binding protein [Bifidobacterium platyrrhinorum]|uniref:ATP-binding cassette domain-containing protein n=1 Tax=Bifidobacterium platyrrhinorum TaxID=2661628 RepID=A0A6L9SPU8_9BIFI|nr:ATP-binding cassette domain-containing protein [Bifidobacterium platyrrhinorum]NEG54546.1 ATP-binding cassette domain-containing protein [Bifidobacterium platyrrhinorum]